MPRGSVWFNNCETSGAPCRGEDLDLLVQDGTRLRMLTLLDLTADLNMQKGSAKCGTHQAVDGRGELPVCDALGHRCKPEFNLADTIIRLVILRQRSHHAPPRPAAAVQSPFPTVAR